MRTFIKWVYAIAATFAVFVFFEIYGKPLGAFFDIYYGEQLEVFFDIFDIHAPPFWVVLLILAGLVPLRWALGHYDKSNDKSDWAANDDKDKNGDA